MRWLELRVPPLVIFGVCALLMWLLRRQFPPFEHAFPGQGLLAIVLLAIGLAIAIAGVWQFRRARTTTNPMKPDTSSALVQTGVYRFTRNPMYLGLVLVLLGFAVYLGNALALAGPAAFALYLTRFQIQPEEQSLRKAFGAEFERYQRAVRRWI